MNDYGTAALGAGMMVFYIILVLAALALVIWLLTIVAKLANKTGRSAVGWVVIGIFIGAPTAMALLLALERINDPKIPTH